MNIKNNYEQKEYISGLYTRAASIYDRVGFKSFSYFFGKCLVELISIPKKAKVLDIAAGRGASLFPALKKVGPEGEVIGIDISKGMVKETNNDIIKRGFSNGKMINMDAENLKFENNTFDIVMCGLSVFLFPNYEIALKEAFRVLKPYGSIGISTFCSEYSSGYSLKWQKALLLGQVAREPIKEEELMMLFKLKKVDIPEFSTVKGMKNILIKTGFKEVYNIIKEKEFICENAEEWWKYLWSTGSRSVLEKISLDNLVKLKERTIKKFNKYSLKDGLHQKIKVIFTFGKK
ncbi:MAG: methyltransferase domain-containing protein [Promethearchaeota archaeon]